MKQMNLLFCLLAAVTFTTSCSLLPRKQARTAASVQDPVYEDTAMVNVVSANRMPASAGPSVEVSKPADGVSVSAQLSKYPGEKLQHGHILFIVRQHPEVAGQISGNSGGSTVSVKFTNVVQQIQAKGANAKASQVLVSAQNRFNGVARLPAEEREEAIRTILLETRDQLLAAY